MEEEKMTLRQLEKDLLDELDDCKDAILDNKYPEDMLHEMIDGWVPIYNSDIVDVGNSDIWLTTTEPEIYAFSGEKTAVNAIAGNIYQHLSEIAYKWLEDVKKEKGN